MNDAQLYDMVRQPGHLELKDRVATLERAFARYLRSQGWNLRDIAKLLEVKMSDVKVLLGE